MFWKKEPSIKEWRKREKERLHKELQRQHPGTPDYQRTLDQLKEFAEIEQMEGSKSEKILPTIIGVGGNLVGILLVTNWENIGNLVSTKALNVAYKVKS